MINLAYIHYYFLMLAIFLVLIIDNKSFRIKNWIFYPLVIVSFFLNYHINGREGLYDSISGAIIPVLLLLIFTLLGILDIADVKLFSMIGAIMGLNFILFTILYSVLVQFLATLIIIKVKTGYNLKERLGYFCNHLKFCWTSRAFLPYYGFDYAERRSRIPFTFAIICGVLFRIITA